MGRPRDRSETKFQSADDGLARRLALLPNAADSGGSDDRDKPNDDEEEEEERGGGQGFFACYLLTSLSPRHKGHTYIGFTVNPRRRIRQHNGEIRSGAWRTKRGRPWEMVLCIYGFPSNVSALQFEWAWQHPRESLAVRKAASNFTSLSGISNKIKIAYTMLSLPAWENLNLTVNFFSTKYMKYTAGCPSLPKKMKVVIAFMDELPCYIKTQALDDYNEDDDEDTSEEDMLSTSSDTLINHLEGEDHHPSVITGDSHSNWDMHEDFTTSTNPKSSLRVESSQAKDDSVNYDMGYDYNLENVSNNDFNGIERQAKPATTTSAESSKSYLKNCNTYSLEMCSEDPFRFIEQNDFYSMEGQSTPNNFPREFSSKSLLPSQVTNVIDLSSPPLYLASSLNIKSKKAFGSPEIIDLTDSPMIIQL